MAASTSGLCEPGEDLEPVGAGVLAVDLGQPARRRVVGRDDGAVAVEQHQARCVREARAWAPSARRGCGTRPPRSARRLRRTATSCGVERSAPRLAEEAADAPGLAAGAEHHPQLVVVALRLQEVAVAGAAHRPVVGGRAQASPPRRRRGRGRRRGWRPARGTPRTRRCCSSRRRGAPCGPATRRAASWGRGRTTWPRRRGRPCRSRWPRPPGARRRRPPGR